MARRLSVAVRGADVAASDIPELIRPESTPSGPSPIEEVRFAARFVRPEVGFSFRATSLPGHLLHLTLAGQVQQVCNGRSYRLGSGDLLWYHNDELVEGRVVSAPWIYLSVLLHAPTLLPPEPEARLMRGVSSDLGQAMASLVEAWMAPTDVARGLRVHAQANALLAAILTSAPRQAPMADASATEGRLWWLAESWLRDEARAGLRSGLDDLATALGVSRRSLERSCRLATGRSPRDRVRFLRLAAARGLVLRSSLSLTEIADRLGWPRVQELSRDYARRYGRPPSVDRREAASDLAVGVV